MPTQFSDADFSVVSNNCWGAHIYEQARLPYRTPFVGLFMQPRDYLRMVQDIQVIFDTPLRFTRETDRAHPVGKLGELTLYFLHYKSEAAAADAWTRRLARFTRRADRVFLQIRQFRR